MTHQEWETALNNLKIAHKDHFHFTNTCIDCVEYIDDDKLMVPVRIILNGYPESHYMCQKCVDKRRKAG